MSLDDSSGVCVITHPLSASGENATRTLLAILDAITTVSLVTADLPHGSAIREQHEVVELTSSGAGDNIITQLSRFVLNQIRMCYIIYHRNEQILLFFGATSYVLPVVLAKLLRRTVVIEPRGDVALTLRLEWEPRYNNILGALFSKAVKSLERINFFLADAIITYTPAMAEQLDLGDYESKLFTSGARYVDTEKFSPQVPLKERDLRVGYLGRLNEEKGIRMLADVASHIPERYCFRFIGDGHLREWLQENLARDIAAGSVEVVGWVNHDDVPNQLNQLRLLIMTSEPTEGLPTTILESLACGTPVFATPVSGIPDVIEDGKTGFIIDESDPEQIADKISAILERQDLGKIASNGRELIEDTYSFEKAVTRYRDILGSIEQR